MSDERLLATFLELVRLDSPSEEEATVAAYCIDALGDAGMDVRVDGSAAATGSDTGNVIATSAGDSAGMSLVLCAHMDTVEPGRGVVPVVEDGIVRSAGDTVLGADDKAGLAAIVETVRRLHETGAQHGPLRVVLTVCEEYGLRGAKQLSPADVAGDLCLVPDADGAVGGIVTAAPTHYTFAAEFHGRAAHAGVEPEKGRSAVRMAADAISAMRLGRLDEATTANVGSISGGGRTNVVAASCRITGECRSLDRDRVETVRAEMDRAMAAAAAGHGGTVDVEWQLEYEGFAFNQPDPLLDLVNAACDDVGVSPRFFATGGGSDANILSGKGVPTLVLSSGMRDVHGTSETLVVSEMGTLVRLLLAMVERVRER